MAELRVAESRKSTRVPLKVVIVVQGINEQLTCDGETIIVNRHGALISCTAPLRVEMKIEIYVVVTDKRALAKVVFVDPERANIKGL
jgi:translation initiation factor 6 (eIF-6)